jgi:hypothetical protein
MFSFKEWYIKGTKFGSVKALEKIFEAVKSLFKFDGTAYTDANGERFLKDSQSTQDIKLVSGRGLQFNGVDQYVDTGFIPDISQPFTMIMPMINSTYSRHGVSTASTKECTVKGISGDNTTFAVDVGNVGSVSIPTGCGYLQRYDVTVVSTGSNVTIYRNGVSTGVSFNYTFQTLEDNFYLMAWNEAGTAGLFMQSTLDGFYFIPQAFTAQEVNQHYNSPEKTIYRENGVLKSDILPQATLDSMAAGNGFAYLMTENENCSGYLTDICTNTTSAVENWSSTMHTNVADHSHGVQTALLEQDANGVPTGLATIDVQATDFTDAQTQFSSENGLALTDNEGTLELRVSYPSEIATEDGQVIQTEDGQTLEV